MKPSVLFPSGRAVLSSPARSMFVSLPALALLLLALALAPTAPAEPIVPVTIYVDATNTAGPWTGSATQPYRTIQSAIDAAHPAGYTIIVRPGRYIENIKFKNKLLVLQSTNPLSAAVVKATILDGGGKGSVVTFGGQENTAVLSGFTITGGKARYGGGISGNGTHATIQHNRIVNNQAYEDVVNSVPGGTSIYHWIHYTDYFGFGGAIARCDGRIQNNIIAGNKAGGPLKREYVEQFGSWGQYINDYRNRARSFEGGALYECNGKIRNNTLYDHTVALPEQGSIVAFASCKGQIINNIIWTTRTPHTSFANCSAPQYCIHQDPPGETNLNLDPLFIDPAIGDYRLQAASPAIDAGGAMADLGIDIEGIARGYVGATGSRGDGSHIDIGAHEYKGFNPPTAAAPAILPASGSYLAPLTITMSAPGAGIQIRYTLDSSEPTLLSSLYNQPLVQDLPPGTQLTVKARAFGTGYIPSPVTQRTYTFKAPALLCVDAGAAAAGNGSAARPFNSLNAALDHAGTSTTIFVAGGIYNEKITLKPAVKLYGGFPRGNFAWSARNWNANPTTITQSATLMSHLVTMAPRSRLDGFVVGKTFGKSADSPVSGVYCGSGVGRDTVVANCAIVRNVITGILPNSVAWGGGVMCEGTASPTIIKCLIQDNVAGVGGGVCCAAGASPLLSGCTIIGNFANGHWSTEFSGLAVGGFGGGVNCISAADAPVLQNCLILWNDATFQGGGVMGGMATILNCTLYGNAYSPSYGQAAKAGILNCFGTIRNCIIWGNPGGQLSNCSTPAYSCIQGWTRGGTGNFAADPLLTGNFRLIYNSPCIDAGCAIAGLTTDMSGGKRGHIGYLAPRGDGSHYDIGAFEYGGKPLVALPAITLAPAAASVRMTIACPTAGAAIYYTTNGATPTTASARYTAPVSLTGRPGTALKIRARAFMAGGLPSCVAAASYNFSPVAITQISRAGVVADTLQTGKLVYGDRSFRFTLPIPSPFPGQVYVRTLNNDKAGGVGLSFTASHPVVVYVAMSSGFGTARPAWLGGWTLLSNQFPVTDGDTRRLYRKAFSAGPVVLGPNREGSMPVGPSMYSVIVVPQ